MDRKYDVAVIGGGVVGCAVAFELTRCGYSCVVLEKSHALLTGASSGNSGMLHTGYDAKGPVELDCIKRSQARVFDILHTLNVPAAMHGATMVAWNENQFQRLPDVIKQVNDIGIDHVQQLSPSECHQKEPNISRKCIGGVFIPGESVTDPWLFPVLLANDARQKGAQLITECQLESCDWSGLEWTLHTSRGLVNAACVVNTAGLYGDIVDKLVGKNKFRIYPRKGQYSMYNKSARCLINSSIIPVPTDIGKGVIVFKSDIPSCLTPPEVPHGTLSLVSISDVEAIAELSCNPNYTIAVSSPAFVSCTISTGWGGIDNVACAPVVSTTLLYDNVVVGPTAEQVESRLTAPIDDVITSRLHSVAMDTVPTLAEYKVIREYTGVRPATQYKDYIIESDSNKNWITVGGIRSTGLSGCLGIGEIVRDLVKDDIRIEPSRGTCTTLTRPDVCTTKYGTCIIDNVEHTVTHPLTLAGHISSESKL